MEAPFGRDWSNRPGPFFSHPRNPTGAGGAGRGSQVSRFTEALRASGRLFATARWKGGGARELLKKMVGCRTLGGPVPPAPCSTRKSRARDLQPRRQTGVVAPLCIAAVVLLAALPRASAFAFHLPTSGKTIWQSCPPSVLNRRRTLQRPFGCVPLTALLRAEDGRGDAARGGPGLREAVERPSAISGWSSFAAGGRRGVRSKRGGTRGAAVTLRSSLSDDAEKWEWETQESPPYHCALTPGFHATRPARCSCRPSANPTRRS